MFERFRTHYIQNVYTAVSEWLKAHEDMERTPIHTQMLEIQREALTAFIVRKGKGDD